MENIIKKLKWEDGILAVGVGLLIVGLGMTIRDAESKKPKVEIIKGEIKGVVEVSTKLMIDIEGAVERPGVYELKNGDRISDVLVICGGLNKDADRQWVEKNINRAEKLRDGMKIYIPKTGEQLQVTSDKGKQGGLISINTATIDELDKLSGVGPSMAQKIIDYREKNGGFMNVEEIKLVAGIGEKMYEKIKDQISL